MTRFCDTDFMDTVSKLGEAILMRQFGVYVAVLFLMTWPAGAIEVPRGFHDRPLNVFTDQDAVDQLPVLLSIVSAELPNSVFRADYRIVPATLQDRAIH